MRQWRLHGWGIDALRLDDVPDPAAGGDLPHGQVVVRVRAVSLNYRDLLVTRGQYDPRLAHPVVPLSDAAGEVVALGPGCTRFRTGERVCPAFMPDWVDGPIRDACGRSALGASTPGVAAEFVMLPESALVAIPPHLTFAQAATLPCAAVTAWHALVTAGRATAGESVLLLGTGGVSIFALQFARLHGQRVVITSGSPAKLPRALALGAEAAIDTRATPEWDREARRLCGGPGPDHVVDVGGSGTLPRSLKAVRTGGRVSVIGVLSGGENTLGPLPILMKSLTLQGIYVGSRAMFEAMNLAVAAHRLVPVVDRVLPLADLPAGMRHLESGTHFGKVVLEW